MRKEGTFPGFFERKIDRRTFTKVGVGATVATALRFCDVTTAFSKTEQMKRISSEKPLHDLYEKKIIPPLPEAVKNATILGGLIGVGFVRFFGPTLLHAEEKSYSEEGVNHYLKSMVTLTFVGFLTGASVGFMIGEDIFDQHVK